MTRNELRAHLIKRRDEMADDGRWLGGSHGQCVNRAWIKGHDSLLEHVLDLYEALKKQADYCECAKCGNHVGSFSIVAVNKFHDAIGVKG